MKLDENQREQLNSQTRSIPDYHLEQISFDEPCVCRFTMLKEDWSRLDQKLEQWRELLPKNFAFFNRQVQAYKRLLATDYLITYSKNELSQAACRSYSFRTSTEIIYFVKTYDMDVEKCLKSMAFDPNCPICPQQMENHEFFNKDC